MLYLDLDNFELLNDTMGRNMGDALLRQVYSSDGFREGVRAFLAKEKPRFDLVQERLDRS